MVPMSGEPLSDDLPLGGMALPATPAAPGLARAFLVHSLVLELSDVVDVAVLLTSELVANAVLYGLEPIRLQLHRHGGLLRIEVQDGGLPFTPGTPGAWSMTDEGGRGLSLVDALASSWGCHSGGAALAGKTLWFELADDEPDLAAAAVSRRPARDDRRSDKAALYLGQALGWPALAAPCGCSRQN